MNRDQFKGKWNELKGKIKEKWGKLTDDDITQINGEYDQFIGSLQQRYGYQQDQAEKELENWNLDSSTSDTSSLEENRDMNETGESFEGEQEEGFRRKASKDLENQDMYKGQDRNEGDLWAQEAGDIQNVEKEEERPHQRNVEREKSSEKESSTRKSSRHKGAGKQRSRSEPFTREENEREKRKAG